MFPLLGSERAQREHTCQFELIRQIETTICGATMQGIFGSLTRFTEKAALKLAVDIRC